MFHNGEKKLKWLAFDMRCSKRGYSGRFLPIFLILSTTFFLRFQTDIIRRYHTVMNHSRKMNALGAQFDFQGVILLMWGATVPLLYYGFYCDSALQRAYSTLVRTSILIFLNVLTKMKLSVLAVICSLSTFQPRFRDPYLRPVRAATFGSLAIFTMVPVVHGIYKYSWKVQSQRMGVVWVVITLILNVSGATAYAFKVC
jgi:adiponectin receptor